MLDRGNGFIEYFRYFAMIDLSDHGNASNQILSPDQHRFRGILEVRDNRTHLDFNLFGSLHADSHIVVSPEMILDGHVKGIPCHFKRLKCGHPGQRDDYRSEEHTSELQSRENLVCRLLLEKKK